MKEFQAYSIGLCSASICTSLDPDQALERMNAEHPTGVHPWVLSTNAVFRCGTENPCVCPDAPETHKHYLLNC